MRPEREAPPLSAGAGRLAPIRHGSINYKAEKREAEVWGGMSSCPLFPLPPSQSISCGLVQPSPSGRREHGHRAVETVQSAVRAPSRPAPARPDPGREGKRPSLRKGLHPSESEVTCMEARQFTELEPFVRHPESPWTTLSPKSHLAESSPEVHTSRSRSGPKRRLLVSSRKSGLERAAAVQPGPP